MKYLIFLILLSSCSTVPVHFNSSYNWTNQTKTKPVKVNCSFVINLKNRVCVEDAGVYKYFQDNQSEIEYRGKKIVSYTIFTSDSTGITFIRKF